jgi:hypothetical protein
MSNTFDANLMDKEWYWEEQAEQAMMGVCEYLGVKYIPKENKENDVTAGGEEIMNKTIVTFEGYHDAGAADILAYLKDGKAVHVADLSDDEKNTTGERYAVGRFSVYSVPDGFTPIKGTDRADTLLMALKTGGRIK